MKTLQKQISLFTEEQLTYSQGASHANHIQAQASDLGKRTSDISGRICSESFQKLNQPTLWGKTFVDLLIGMGEWSSKKCALTWKVKGTKYNRYYCQLVPSVRPIEEIGFGSLLKTPSAMDSYSENLSKKEQKFGNSGTLAQEIQSGFVYQRGMLPTPNAFDYNTPRKEETFKKAQERHAAKGVNLQNPLKQMAAMGMLPTPTVSDIIGTPKRPDQITQTPTGWARKSDNTGTIFGAKLNDVAPIIAGAKYQIGKPSQLNPRFVAEMMGFPPNWTELPFQSGDKNQ